MPGRWRWTRVCWRPKGRQGPRRLVDKDAGPQGSKFYNSRRGQQLYRRRGQTVEPFNNWFKERFDLASCVWHRGLANNMTQITAAILLYQVLLRYNRRRGGKNGNIQWILDAL